MDRKFLRSIIVAPVGLDFAPACNVKYHALTPSAVPAGGK